MKKRGRTAAAAVVLAAAVLLFCGCETYDMFYGTFIDRSAETYETVKIGVFEPFSGSDKKSGAKEVLGIELANELYPTCMGKTVELVYADHKSDIYVAEEVIQELIEEKPAVILGSYGSVYSLVAGKYVREAEIPTIAITNTNPLVTKNNPYYFRVCYVDSYQGIALAKYAAEELGQQKAAVLKPKNDDVAAALSSAFEDKFTQLTGDSEAAAAVLEYDSGAESFAEPLEEIRKSGARVVFLPASATDGVRIIREARKAGLPITFLGTEAWDTQSFAEAIGDASGMAVFSSMYDPDIQANPTTEKFLAAYREKYGEDVQPDPETALGFDAYLVAIAALDRIGTAKDGDLLRQSLLLTLQYPGASGSITLSENGDPMRSVAVKGIVNGKPQKIYTMEPNIR